MNLNKFEIKLRKKLKMSIDLYDIVIVGAGAAGISCAIASVARNKKIAVIEKDGRVGGTLHLTAGHLSAGGTKRQKAKNIEDSPEKHYAEVMRISENTAIPEIVRLATQEAPKTIDWLESMGFPFAEETPVIINGHVPYQTPRTYWGVADYAFGDIKTSGKTLVNLLVPLFDKSVAEGKIDLFLDHRLDQIILENGAVKGIIASNQGNKKTFFGKNTVLTTGGYASNPEFYAQVTPNAPRLISTASPNSQGEGIIIAQKIGAGFRGGEKHLGTLGGIEIEPNSGRTDFWRVWGKLSNAIDRLPKEIYVNELGKRFIHEDEPSPDVRERAVAMQPNRRFWVIFDEKALFSEGICLIPQFTPQRIKQESEQGKYIWKANTINELAEKIGIDKNRQENLNKTVIYFNEAVKQGIDREFGRKYLKYDIVQPPFYALLVYAFSLISFGGVTVNQDLQVTDKEGNIVPNLYAAGEILGAGATSGNAFCGGMLLTPALSFGRWLGERL